MQFLPWVIVLISAGLGALVLFIGRRDPVEQRLDDLSGSPRPHKRHAPVRIVLPTPPTAHGTSATLSRSELAAKPTFHDRLLQAGFYKRLSTGAFVLFRTVAFLLPLGIGIAAGYYDVLPRWTAIVLGLAVAGLGTIAPSFWLDYLKGRRQTQMRRALPDALDTMVVCLEGGLSLTGALSRIAAELATAHPLLAVELKIVEREVQMGRSTGEALRSLAKRFDLEELRSMAMVIIQSERFGASVSTALSVFADTMRQKRGQRAEELAHKASVKIIFPTLFCIFPAMFVVILGPAAIQIAQQLFPVFTQVGR